MDIGRSFSYILEDEEWWKKILIGGLLTLIPVFTFYFLPQFPGSKQVGQSEEHLVLQFTEAKNVLIGTECYAVPMHICPTVIKYPEALVVTGGKVTARWQIAARDYHLTD